MPEKGLIKHNQSQRLAYRDRIIIAFIRGKNNLGVIVNGSLNRPIYWFALNKLGNKILEIIRERLKNKQESPPFQYINSSLLYMRMENSDLVLHPKERWKKRQIEEQEGYEAMTFIIQLVLL